MGLSYSVGFDEASNVAMNFEILRLMELPYHHRLQHFLITKGDGCVLQKDEPEYYKNFVFRRSYPKREPDLRVLVKLPGGKGQDVDPIRLATGVIDTGAQSVCVQKGICKERKWPLLGRTEVLGATGSEKVGIYQADLILCGDKSEDRISVDGVPVLGADLPGGIDVLVGYPLLKNFELRVLKDFAGFELR